METGILEEFVVIARLGSFSRAAEELNISQSSLSKHILALERELDVQLLIRSSRHVDLSPAGEKLLPIAENICDQVTDFISTASTESRRGKTTLRLLSIPVMAQYGITVAIGRFRREHPEISLQVEECEQQALPERLRTGNYDLAFSRRTGPMSPDLACCVYRPDHLVAVMRQDHPLARFDTVQAEQLQDIPLLLMDSNTGLYELYATLFERSHITPQTVFTGHRPENIFSLVSQSMGVGLLMQGHADFYRTDGLTVREVLPRTEGDICLMWRQGARLSAGTSAFLDLACPGASDNRAYGIPSGNESCSNKN